MKNYKILFQFLFLSLISLSLPLPLKAALQEDERLTVRILKLSSTKKTILINRGEEDGLAVGNHAKFFLPEGVLARGVVVRVTPSRSVWSLYRLSNPDRLKPHVVVSARITAPVKVTDDPSKMLRAGEDVGLAGGIALAEGADDLPKTVEASDKEEIAQLRGDDIETKARHWATFMSKTWEFYGLFHMSVFQNSSSIHRNTEYIGDNSYYSLGLGVEKYLGKLGGFLKRISLVAFVHRNSQEVSSLEGITVSNGSTDYGGGINWHFPALYNVPEKLVGMISVTGGMTKANDSTSFDVDNVQYSGARKNGDGNFYSVGIGGKYFLSNGFGFRILLDYYNRSEKYSETTGITYSRKTGGPRLHLGLSYRL